MPLGVPQIGVFGPGNGKGRRRARIVRQFGLNATLALATGCGGELAVRGHVTADGQPVHAGTITFQRTDRSGAAIGGPVQNGEFDLGKGKGLLAGEYGATLEGFQTTRRTINDYQRGPIPETVPLTLVENTLTVQLSQSNARQLTLDFHSKKTRSKQ
ncbi:MAG: hypothetical protein IT427_16580 [Pirellulales bacterium]|nr:hypothetical protein [Pirellulales bacterium]